MQESRISVFWRRIRALAPMLALALPLLPAAAPAAAGEALAAVAANFAGAAGELAARFEAETGQRVALTTGSTGKLYAQIRNGAPFALLLSADAATPARLEEEGFGVKGTRFTYAKGRLALWSAEAGRIGEDGKAALEDETVRRIAIANPALAPYGVAAEETLAALGLLETLRPKLVYGQNAGQAHSMAATGGAQLGFVALSAVQAPPGTAPSGSYWDVPQDLFSPIRQDALLLVSGRENEAAIGFLGFLKSPEAREIIARHGYSAE